MRYPLLALTFVLALPVAATAQGFVESISPPVVERGKTTRVTFVGRQLANALDVWHSLPAGALRAKPVESRSDRAVFDVTAAADAPVGVCGVRVATTDGLTNAHLFLVDDLPVRPRASGDSPMSLPPGTAVWGTLREGAIDRYTLTAAAGERISIEVVANRFGKDADPLVTIRDSAGNFVAERDNDPGLYFDCRFEHTFATAGTYTLDVRDARFKGNEHHHYVLRVGRFPAGRVAVPSAVETGFRADVTLPEVPGSTFPFAAARADVPGPVFAAVKRPGDHGSAWVPLTAAPGPVTVTDPFDPARDSALSQLASGPAGLGFLLSPMRANPFTALDRHLTLGRPQATPAAVPGTLCGVLRTPNRADAFRLRLAKGQRLYLRGEAKALNSPADLELVVTDRTGKELRRAGEQRDDVTLDFTAPAAGDYGLFVRDTLRDGGDAFAYRITARTDPFPPQLTAEVEGLTVPQGSYQPMPITVARTGPPGPIKLHLLGAPPGLRLTPDEISESATSVVCRLEADGTAPPGVHTIQILAECGGEWVAVRTQPLIDRKLVNVDLIPHALREDQRRLPPSLTDRFAVQVTPSAPFTFELPEPAVRLARYQKAPIPVVTTRTPGFDGPITFTAAGGQLADKNEGRTRVYADFPEATAATPNVSGVVVSKILSNLGKSRIEMAATGTHAGRRVTLTRTFELEIITAFKVTADPPKVTLLPGESTKVKLTVERVPSFAGPVTLRFQPQNGVTIPETVTIPKGATAVTIDVAVSPDAGAGRRNLVATATGDVDEFEEEFRVQLAEVEVKKVEPPKKK
jgi:hypothetical protein